MESILYVDIPIQMKNTPMKFRFRDKTGEIITVMIDKVPSEDQNRIVVNEFHELYVRT